MFVLVGQILNARGRFGPMMWAPIANNVISVAVLVVYLVVFGPVADGDQCAAFTTGQELLLGLGSTLGIAVQFLILLPYLRAAGFHYRPRFDFRGTGLGHTLRLGVWTVLFVVVNQVAYTVVVRLASGGTAQPSALRQRRRAATGTGYTVYSAAFLIVMVPHAIDHGLAGHRDPAPALAPGPPTATCAALAAHPGPARCAPRSPSSCRSRCCCRSSRPTSPT